MKKRFQKAICMMLLVCTVSGGPDVLAAEAPDQVIGTIETSAEKWYENTRLIAHALGVIDGKAGTNSKEAFLQSYDNGFEVLEADFSVTSDGALVVRHDFDQDSYYTLEQVVKNGSTQMDLARYISEKICFRYTPLTAKDLITLMAEHEGIYVVTDTKNTDMANVTRDFNLLVKDATELGHREVLDRFIVQIYNEEMVDTVRNIYPFPNWIYTLYQTKDPDYAHIADFCVEKGIDVVTMNYEVLTPERVKTLKDRGITVFAFTVNSLLHMKKYVGYGIQGVYTDTISPSELSYIGLAEKKNATKKLYINGRISALDCYTIDGEDYYSLHALAYLLMDTKDHFSISMDAANRTISVGKGQEYQPTGNELMATDGFGVLRKNPNSLLVDGTEFMISSYEISGKYFYSLTELCDALGIKTGWNGKYAVNEVMTAGRQESKEASGK